MDIYMFKYVWQVYLGGQHYDTVDYDYPYRYTYVYQDLWKRGYPMGILIYYDSTACPMWKGRLVDGKLTQ